MTDAYHNEHFRIRSEIVAYEEKRPIHIGCFGEIFAGECQKCGRVPLPRQIAHPAKAITQQQYAEDCSALLDHIDQLESEIACREL